MKDEESGVEDTSPRLLAPITDNEQLPTDNYRLMVLFEDIDSIDIPAGRSVHVAVGTFDGVHLAHRALLGRAGGEAHATGGLGLAFTFRNHPRSVVAPDRCPPLLTPWPLKRRLLEAMPLDVVVALNFEAKTAAIPARDFVREVLVGKCRARTIHSGVNFRFGQGGYGGPGLLMEMAEECGYRYEQLEPIRHAGGIISSTRIRELLAEGDVARAADLLARPHEISAPVVAGDALGRTIGFPTANLAVPADALLPKDGVYAVAVRIGDEAATRPGMMNIGWRPTVGGRDHRSEVHLIGFDGDLAGATLAVQFVARLRDEKKFAGVEELKTQLARDREAAGRALQTEGLP